MRKFLLFMWNVLLKAIDVSFKAQTSATWAILENGQNIVSVTQYNVSLWTEKKNTLKAKRIFEHAMLFMHPYMKMSDAEQKVRKFLEAGHVSTEAGSNDMTVRNQIKKKTMAELQKCGLQSVIKDVIPEGDDVIVETDSRLRLRGTQIKQLTGKKIFRNVEELVITDAGEGQIDKADELAGHGWFPNLKKVTVRINTSLHFYNSEIRQAIARPDKTIEIDLLGYFSDYDFNVKVKTEDYVFYSSNMKGNTYEMTLEVRTDSGTKKYKFFVSE